MWNLVVLFVNTIKLSNNSLRSKKDPRFWVYG